MLKADKCRVCRILLHEGDLDIQSTLSQGPSIVVNTLWRRSRCGFLNMFRQNTLHVIDVIYVTVQRFCFIHWQSSYFSWYNV